MRGALQQATHPFIVISQPFGIGGAFTIRILKSASKDAPIFATTYAHQMPLIPKRLAMQNAAGMRKMRLEAYITNAHPFCPTA